MNYEKMFILLEKLEKDRSLFGMRKNKTIVAYLLAGALVAGMLSGCTKSEQSTDAAIQSQTGSNVTVENVEQIVTSSASIDTEFTARDMEVGYEQSTAVQIQLNHDSVSINGAGVTFADQILTINKEGTYILSGQLDQGQIVVNVTDNEKVQIVLNGASIHCENRPAIYIKEADKVFITLQEGTENTLTDTQAEYASDGGSNPDGVIFSKADLTINGSGSLTVTANYKHGIVSKDDLVITGGNFHITANGQGLNGKDCVKIKDGTFELDTQGDGIQSDNTEDETKGFVYIAGGTFAITAQTDGIQAETVLQIDGGTITVTTGGGSENASTDQKGDIRPEWGKWGRSDSSNADTSAEQTASAKGLKSGSKLIINNAAMTINSSDDSIHCNGNVTIAGGTVTTQSGDDGVHADNALLIQNGTISVEKSYEGLEGNNVTITGGTVNVTASDDGINSAGGTDTAMQQRPGKNSFDENSDIFIRINGGNIKVDAAGDGLDSNGNLYIDGGTVYVEGPTNSGNGALDYEGSAIVTSGVVVAVGSAGMAVGFSDSSTQYSILHNLSSAAAANTTFVLKDENGSEILAYTPQKQYQSVVITSPDIKEGTYQFTAGQLTEEITVSSIVTSNGSNGGMQGGGGKQGMRGEKPDGVQPPENEKS